MATELSTIVACTALAFFLRWSVALFPYSGEGKAPRYGDFEAHRHWMEITLNVPLSQWYYNSSVNDLEYWGIDYPPLSAMHSYTLGHAFQKVLPEAVKLKTSRGYESLTLKFLMRLTVVVSDFLVPSLVLYHSIFKSEDKKVAGWVGVMLALAAPPFIMVDYGHFQYNCVSLGLTVLAIVLLLSDYFSFAAIAFTLAVHHKQMSLYHSLTFFAYMVGTLIMKRVDVLTTFRVGTVIASTIGLMWLPFGDYWTFVLKRIFPLKRGVFEDKVGTFWYVADRWHPIKGVYPDEIVAQICGIATIILALPSTFNLFWKASIVEKGQDLALRKTFLLHLFNASIVCFLFSYHVHEKTIMLPALAAVLMTPYYPVASVWFITVASLSLYPLFLEERSHIALLLTTCFFILIAQQGKIFDLVKSTWVKLLFFLSIGGYAALIAGLHFVPPPQHLPHIFQALIAIFSFIHFFVFSSYFHYQQFQTKCTVEKITAKKSTTPRKKKNQ